MTALARLAALVGCTALAASCAFVNDADDHQPPGGLDPVPADQFCSELSELVCQAHIDCCPTPTMTFDDCVSDFSSGCASVFGALATDPRTGYEPAVAAQVLAEGEGFAADCDPAVAPWVTARSGLLRIFTGTVEGGGTCTPNSATDFAAYFSCQDLEQACVAVSGGRSICADRLDVGEPCTADTDCLDGLWCEGTGFFTSGTCAERRAADEPCPKSQACESLVCAIPEGATEGTCVTATPDAVYCGLDTAL